MLHFQRTMCCLFVISLFDLIIFMYEETASNTTRWFFIHANVNFVIALLSIPGIIAFLYDPVSSLTQIQDDVIISATSRWPLTFAVSLHIYHCIGKFNLKAEDIFHHLVFVPTLGISGMICDWGCFGNWLVFFICGFPGGVDYMLLALQKMNKCTNLNQKRISANLNMWVRLPGIIFGVGLSSKTVR